MRLSKSSSVIVLAAAFLIALLIIPVQAPDQQTPYRIIELNENGLVYVYDVLPATNGIARIGFPRNLIKSLVNYACQEDPEPELMIEDNFLWIVVNGVSGREIHLLTVFRDIVSWNPSAQVFSFKIPLHPRVQGLGRTGFSIEIRLPKDAQLFEISPSFLSQISPGLVSGSLSDVDLSQEELSEVSLSFSSKELKLLDIVSAKLLVEVPERRAGISLKVRFYGGFQLSEIKLRLPENFELVGAEDGLGKLSSSVREGGEVVVRLRQPLSNYGVDLFTVNVRLGENSELVKLGDGKISIGLPTPLNTTIWIYDVEIRLKGGELRSWSPEPLELRMEYPEKTILTYRFDHVDPLNAGRLKISLSYEPRMSLFQISSYLVLASLILLVSSMTIIYRFRGRVVEKKLGETLFDEAGLIAGVYQKMMDLISSERIYDRSLARKTLLELRSEVRQEAERIKKLGAELVKEELKAAEQVKDLIKAVEDLQRSVEKTWSEVYPYLSRSLPRSKLDKALEGCRRDLKKAYDSFISELEGLRRRLC